MAQEVVLLDTSVLIDYFRKTDKRRTFFVALEERQVEFRISAITVFEVYAGATSSQLSFWDTLLNSVGVMPFGSAEARRAVTLQATLKEQRKQLAAPDLFIASTALEAKLPIATLDRRHFGLVPGLVLHAP